MKINIFMIRIRQQGPSLEQVIRKLHEQNKNKPSPLQIMNENTGFAPTQVPQSMRQSRDIRDNLLSNFIPSKDTFR
jgi:hypothetical protein